jgi:hypothetical protein
MRSLIHEMDFEKPLRAGQLQYERNGQPTGTVESWRLTAAVDDYRFLRVDLDARGAASGLTYLYHLVLSPDGRPERLKYRVYGPDREVIGDLLFTGEALVSSREVDGRRFEEERSFGSGCLFWFPSVVALALAAGSAGSDGGDRAAVLLHQAADFGLQTVTVRLKVGEEEDLVREGRNVPTWPYSIRWPGEERTVWLDRQGWPMKMIRGDGLAAVEKVYIDYRQAA